MRLARQVTRLIHDRLSETEQLLLTRKFPDYSSYLEAITAVHVLARLSTDCRELLSKLQEDED